MKEESKNCLKFLGKGAVGPTFCTAEGALPQHLNLHKVVSECSSTASQGPSVKPEPEKGKKKIQYNIYTTHFYTVSIIKNKANLEVT